MCARADSFSINKSSAHDCNFSTILSIHFPFVSIDLAKKTKGAMRYNTKACSIKRGMKRQIFGRVGFRDTYFHIFRGIGRIGRLDSDHFLFATAGVRLWNSIKRYSDYFRFLFFFSLSRCRLARKTKIERDIR